MKPFEHLNATSLDEAAAALRSSDRARAIAGGTDLLGTMKDNIHNESPALLVNLKTIPGMDRIEEDGEWLRIGAMVRLSEIASHPLIRTKYTALAEAALSVATPQIRRMATLGGNLCQEPRCWYYRHPENHFHCLRKGGDICGALVGENRYHSILGAARMAHTPCSTHCPAETDIPDYLESIRSGDLNTAASILLKNNPFPAITGRVCPHYCQEGCNRKEFDQAVSIREVERTLGDYILQHKERFFQPPAVESGKQVAVVGSGPGGLAAAVFLRRAGHRVTIFERQEKAGGMLAYSIPAYRLPAETVEQTIECLETMGIEIRCGVEIGKDIPYHDLQAQHNAVFLASGAWGTPKIGLEDEVRARSGLDFLKAIREGLRETPGQNVVVIGGGNVAVDVAISARRLGAGRVTLICLETREEMPALEAELEQALEEGIAVMNSWGPKRVIVQDGRVAGLELVHCSAVFDAEGRFAPQFDPQQVKQVETDAVLMAVGQRPETAFLPGAVLSRGWLAVGEESGATALEGVFGGGDAVRTANVIDAVAAAHRAARSMHVYLTGETLPEPAVQRGLVTFDPRSPALAVGVALPAAKLEARWIDREDRGSLPQALAEAEARRCLNCGCVAVTPSDTGAALAALDAVIVTTRRQVAAEDFFACRVNSSTILDPGELVTEVRIPAARPGLRSAYRKFRLRQSIDFPLASAAVALEIEAGVIRAARAVLGAAAPTPVREQAVETYLEGKAVQELLETRSNEQQARRLPCQAASDLALAGAIPLAENAYKIQITRAYLRRAICACLEE